MASTQKPAKTDTWPYYELHDVPEGNLILAMMAHNGVSVAKTVDKIIALTHAAAVSTAKDDPVWTHASRVADTIHMLSKSTKHDQQSKLVAFALSLQQVTVPDPETGGTFALDKKHFWTDMPELAMTQAEYFAYGNGVDEEGNHENALAFFAQLSEAGFMGYRESMARDYPDLMRLFNKDNLSKVEIRVMCMWFIYAPKKVWLDVQSCRTYNGNQFPADSWPKWKQFLQVCRSTPAKHLKDESTQDLIKQALDNIDRIEKAQVPSEDI